MKCVDCEYYVGDYDETTDCYQPYCPFVDPEPVEHPDWYYEEKEQDKLLYLFED